jgi:hypothetical protein
MTRYKSFGAFLNQYVGPSDKIKALKREFKRQISSQCRQKQAWMWQTPADVHSFVKDRYADRDVLASQLLHAKTVFYGSEHESQVRTYQGWHSRTKPKKSW